MASYTPLLPFRIHPFWVTLAYGMFVGYEIRKHDIDGIIKRRLAAKRDEAIKHQANLLLDVAEERKLALIPDIHCNYCTNGCERCDPRKHPDIMADLNGTKG